MAQTQKQGKPTGSQPDEWQQDLNPQPMASHLSFVICPLSFVFTKDKGQLTKDNLTS